MIPTLFVKKLCLILWWNAGILSFLNSFHGQRTGLKVRIAVPSCTLCALIISGAIVLSKVYSF